jgi:hypothetical protein
MIFVSRRRAVGNMIFASTVIVLLVVAASGFLLYSQKSSMTETTTDVMTETMTQTAMQTSESMSETSTSSGSMSASAQPGAAIAFASASGQMFGGGWLTTAPIGNGSYIVSIYATGLESSSMGDYIVEAAQNSGSMAMVPIGGSNATLSEFDTSSHGTGQFSIVLHQDPASIYESVSLVYLPGMAMTNATVVASAPLSMS